ncbi:hypothetical protein KC345_g101 [Hortaea werneckii]|nr:hypothetical protein KC345_g101 [Hortaea werneckii]
MRWHPERQTLQCLTLRPGDWLRFFQRAFSRLHDHWFVVNPGKSLLVHVFEGNSVPRDGVDKFTYPLHFLLPAICRTFVFVLDDIPSRPPLIIARVLAERLRLLEGLPSWPFIWIPFLPIAPAVS